jgi:PST family polysaccharide transporter
LSDPGFAAALIQKGEIEDRHVSSVFWLNIMIGAMLMGTLIALGNFITGFYHEPRLAAIVPLVSSVFFINAFKSVHVALLTRALAFRRLAVMDTLTTLVAGAVAIALALRGHGVWSLAWQAVVSSLIGAIIVWWISDWRPRHRFDLGAVRELLNFSMNLFGFNAYNYWAKNIDNLLIGKFIGSAGLGIYSKAYEFLMIPVNHISATVGQVMYPSMSRIKDDKKEVKIIYLEALRGIAFVSFPLMIGLCVVADSFVLALYGERWAGMIPILQIFCVLGVIHSVAATAGWIYQSQGRTDWFFRWGIFSSSITVGGIIAGVVIGTPVAVALCFAITSGIIHIYPNFSIPGRLIGMSLKDVCWSVSDVFACAVLMAVGVWSLGCCLPASWLPWSRLLAQVSCGAVLYTLLSHLFRLQTYIRLKHHAAG